MSKQIKCILFADDTNLFFSGKCIKYICKVMSMELIKLKSWFALNKLSLNISKTNYTVFGKVDKDELINVSIDVFILTRVCSTKFLSVQIDEGLNWKEHIKLVTSKLIKVSGIIFRTKRVLNYHRLYTLYCSLFLPYIYYCSEIWGNTYKTKLNSIILIPKKVIRAIFGINDMRTNTSPLVYKCGILKFVDFMAYKTLIVIFKVKNNLSL